MPDPNYTLEDFLTDTDFIRWVKSPDDESNAFWNAYISKNIHQSETLQRARRIVLQFEIKDIKISPNTYLELWEKITQATSRGPIKLHDLQIKNTSKFTWPLKAAASVVLILSLSLFLYTRYQLHKPLTVSTGYGESRTLFLPDSTKVTLNANSSISYVEKDFYTQSRKVILEGQAFFDVTHTLDDQNFRVHTRELYVEVLGTRFDVNSRRGTTKVMLEEGKVRVDVQRNDRPANTIVMKPGDLAQVSQESKDIDVSNVNSSTYLAWKNNTLIFNGTPLFEIAQVLEDNYGYEVTFADISLKDRKFSGSSPSDDVPGLLNTLSRIFNIRVTQKGKEIIFNKL